MEGEVVAGVTAAEGVDVAGGEEEGVGVGVGVGIGGATGGDMGVGGVGEGGGAADGTMRGTTKKWNMVCVVPGAVSAPCLSRGHCEFVRRVFARALGAFLGPSRSTAFSGRVFIMGG
jgi:hypothetical protein